MLKETAKENGAHEGSAVEAFVRGIERASERAKPGDVIMGLHYSAKYAPQPRVSLGSGYI